MAHDDFWQVRWGMLKAVIERERKIVMPGYSQFINETYNAALDTVYEAMEALEKADPNKPLRIGMELPEAELLTCGRCGKRDATVRKRICGYAQEVCGEEVEETICDACELEHKAKI
jgi:hypothetical protein